MSQNQKYFFYLGSFPDISRAEISALWPSAKLRSITSQILEVSEVNILADYYQNYHQIIDVLGGTVKIMTAEAEISPESLSRPSSADILNQTLINYILSHYSTDHKLKLALAELGRDHLPPLKITHLKTQLQKHGYAVRYFQTNRHGLSTAILSHKSGIQEFTFIQDPKTAVVYLALTQATQDIDDWTFRDRAKPYADHKKGLLPPKIARIMVNLALGPLALRHPDANHQLTLLDPFCGSGTVLMEAAFSEVQLLGSDLDVKAILGASENLNWLNEQYQFQPPLNVRLITQDATHLKLSDFAHANQQISNSSPPQILSINSPQNNLTQLPIITSSQLPTTGINFLVTEPFLGRQTPRLDLLPQIFNGLEKLYWGAFKNWTHFLADGATLVIILPQTTLKSGQKLNFSPLIDKINQLGYTTKSGVLNYHRPQAVIERQIWQLKFNKKV